MGGYLKQVKERRDKRKSEQIENQGQDILIFKQTKTC